MWCSWCLAVGEGLSLSIERIEIDRDEKVGRVICSVLDTDGRPVRDLRSDEFAIAIEGEGAGVSFATLGKVDPTVFAVLAIDVSGSMKGEKLESAQAAATGFVNSMNPGDILKLVPFSSTVEKSFQPTTDRAEIESQIMSLEAATNTKLFDAVYDCINTLTAVPAARRVLIVLTDGDDTESSVNIEDCIRAALQHKVRIHTVAYGKELSEKDRRITLGRLATLTGGQSFYAPEPSDLASLYSLVAEQLKAVYFLEFAVDSKFLDGTEHELIVSVETDLGLSASASVAEDFPVPIDDSGSRGFTDPHFFGVIIAVFLVLVVGFAAVIYFLARRISRGSTR
jgi:VWFA-related protein